MAFEQNEKPPLKETVEKARETARKETEPGPVRRRRSYLFLFYAIAASSAFLILTGLAFGTDYFLFDLSFTQELQEISPPFFGDLMVWVSWIGFEPQAVIAVGLVIAFTAVIGLRWEAVVIALTAIISQAINLGIKAAVARPRPAADLVEVIEELTSFSFPSGHVMFYTTFFGFLWFLSFTLLKPSVLRTLLLGLFGALVLLVGLSRIYLGQHWSSDVLAAYLLGSLVLWISILVYRWGKPRYFVHQPVAPEDED